MTQTQKRAFYGLILGVLWAVVFVATFVAKGSFDAYETDAGFQAAMEFVIIGGAFVYLAMLVMTRSRGGGLAADERDKAIMARAPAAQLWTAIITLLAWTIFLPRLRSQGGQISVEYLYLITMTTWIVLIIAHSVRILLGYWRVEGNG